MAMCSADAKQSPLQTFKLGISSRQGNDCGDVLLMYFH